MLSINDQVFNEISNELEILKKSRAGAKEQMSGISSLFYKIFLSASDISGAAFRNFYARYRYVLAELALPLSFQKELDSFRRILRREDLLLLASDAFILQASSLLENILKYLDPGSPPTENSYLPDSPLYFTLLIPAKKEEDLRHLKILCTEWTDIAIQGGVTSFLLTGFDLEQLHTPLQIQMMKYDYADASYLRTLIRKDSILSASHLRLLQEKPLLLRTTAETLVTLEPDYLIDTTAIGECFGSKYTNSDLFFLSRLVEDLPGSAALKGSIIGHLLDEIVRGEMGSVEDSFFRAQKEYALKAAQLGKAEMEKVLSSILNEHLTNLHYLANCEKGKKLWIEPAYYSKDFGLQGRLDLLGIDEDRDTRDIVELKSGSPTNPSYSIAWLNHQMQVVCYDMLLESAYGRGRCGTNAVFYSKCGISPYRLIVSEYREKQAALQIRNEIVSGIFQLASEDFFLLQRIITQGIPGLPTYSEPTMATFKKAYNPVTISARYYHTLLAFTLREMINAKTGAMLSSDQDTHRNGFAGLWLDSIFLKEKEYEIIYDLKLVAIDNQYGYLDMRFSNPIPHAFRQGDLIVVYPRTENGYNALSQHILKGSIKELHNDRLLISLFNKQTDYSFLSTFDLWAIERDIFERNYWSTISCLFNFLNSDERKRRLLLGVIEPAFAEGEKYYRKDLTENQNEVLNRALQARDYFLLQGPPGTGKTSTFLVNYIAELTIIRKEPVIILAFTNKAVERICEGLRKPRHHPSLTYLRLGSKHIEDDQLFSTMLQNNDPDIWKKLITEHRIIVSTVATFQNNWLLLREVLPFNNLVVDEASQLTEADICGVISLFNKFILIGDQKQLPAVVTQTVASCKVQNPQLIRLGLRDMRTSLFERLITNARARGWDSAHHQLTHHYRMHQDIAGLISQHYELPLLPALPNQVIDEMPYLLDANHPLYAMSLSRAVFIETIPDLALKKNTHEAALVAFIVTHLIDAGIAIASEIGVITPFRAQIAEIKKYLHPQWVGPEAILIDTVERFQGDERRIIIFSSTISDPAQVHTIQSIATDDEKQTDRKLLVSISRAVNQFVLLGHPPAICAAPAYASLITQIKKMGGYISCDQLQISRSSSSDFAPQE